MCKQAAMEARIVVIARVVRFIACFYDSVHAVKNSVTYFFSESSYSAEYPQRSVFSGDEVYCPSRRKPFAVF